MLNLTNWLKLTTTIVNIISNTLLLVVSRSVNLFSVSISKGFSIIRQSFLNVKIGKIPIAGNKNSRSLKNWLDFSYLNQKYKTNRKMIIYLDMLYPIC